MTELNLNSLIILNNEAIMNEALLFAKWQMANILKVPDSAIRASWILDEDGKINPKFEVDMDEAEGLEESEVKEVLRNVYSDIRDTLSNWLTINRECRDGHENEVLAKKAESSREAREAEVRRQQEESAAQEESPAEAQADDGDGEEAGLREGEAGECATEETKPDHH